MLTDTDTVTVTVTVTLTIILCEDLVAQLLLLAAENVSIEIFVSVLFVEGSQPLAVCLLRPP
jgi:hypothetical protein